MMGGILKFDQDSGNIFILDKKGKVVNPKGLVREHYYERDPKRKLLSRLIAGPNAPTLGIDDADFLATYDLIYIIDTNSPQMNDGKVHHLTSFLRCSIKNMGDSYQPEIYERVGYFHFVNLKNKNSEKVGWINLFNANFFQEDLKANLKIGIVVDSYLAELDAYNAGQTAIIDEFFLPLGVTLMYAGADNKDNLVNKLISANDHLAKDYKRRFLLGEINFPSEDSPMFECESYWFLNEKRNGLSLSRQARVPKGKLIYDQQASITIEMHSIDENANDIVETKTINL